MNKMFVVGKLYKYIGPVVLFGGVWEATRLSVDGVVLKNKDGISIHVRKPTILKDFKLFTPVRIKWKTRYLGVVQ